MVSSVRGPVDPRSIGWEVWNPRYRVDFWRPLGGGAWASRAMDVESDDLLGVLAWADTAAEPEEVWAVYAIVDHRDGPGLVRLVGHDPTRVGPV